MYIEDLIIELSNRLHTININPWHLQLVYSFADQITQSRGFTEKQSNLAIIILKKNAAALSIFGDIAQFINDPKYKLPIRKLDTTKKISIVSDSTYGKVIKVQFPYDEKLITLIREHKYLTEHSIWDSAEKLWIFSLSEVNILFLTSFVNDLGFVPDIEFRKYMTESALVIDNMEDYVPMVVIEEGIIKYKNAHRSIPDLTTNNVIDALFDARKHGIITWSTEVAGMLESSSVHDVTKNFLKTNPDQPIVVNKEITTIECLTNIVNYMSPCLFVIPGGSEIENIKLSYNFLKSININDDEISVMFRLPSSPANEFNAFVRDNNLNSPVTENTRVMFISSRVPKTILKSKIRFNSVINLGNGGVHYSVIEYIDKHHNLVYYSNKKLQKEFNFGNL